MARPIGGIDVRFWAKVERHGPSDCWPWRGTVALNGYGLVHSGGRDGRYSGAHRLMWTLANGPIPDGLSVLHRCDIRHCVNPNHLFLGTQSDNIRDCTLKFRHSRRKLRPIDVIEIRRACSQGSTQRSQARRFNVSDGLVNNIIRGHSWSFLPQPRTE